MHRIKTRVTCNEVLLYCVCCFVLYCTVLYYNSIMKCSVVSCRVEESCCCCTRNFLLGIRTTVVVKRVVSVIFEEYINSLGKL